MVGGRFQLCLSASVLALCTSGHAYAQSTSAESQNAQANAQLERASARRMSFSVPLVSRTRAFGDVLVEVDSTGEFWRVRVEDLRTELDDLLNEAGKAALERAVAGREYVGAEELAPQGFDLAFDLGGLELQVIEIDAELREVQPLIEDRRRSGADELEYIQPAKFSTYMNFIGNFDYGTEIEGDSPDLFLTGATRVGNVVAEYDAALTDQFGGSTRFIRRNTRFVYDEPDKFRRYSAGDLQLETLSLLLVPQIGGVGIEKRRRIFDPSLSVARLNGRQILLDNRSTVSVRVNGEVVETLQLEAGAYDLSNLPIQSGSNNVDLIITDSFGQEEVVSYDFFFENLPLAPGEEEYSVGVGFLADNLGFEPNYTGDLAVSGLYRRAFSENLIVSGAAQASEDVQLLGGSVTSVPQFVPGVFDLEVAGSRSSMGSGVALRAGYRFNDTSSIGGGSQFAVTVDYESGGFTSVTDLLPIDFDIMSVSATYSRTFGIDTVATAGASYFKNGGNVPNDYAVFLDVSHSLNDRMRLTAGVEYGQSTPTRSAFGLRVGISVALGSRTRVNADYRSRFRAIRAAISNGADQTVGSIGYDASISRFGDTSQVDAQLQYEGNRFSARADVATLGEALSGVFDEQRARLQISSALAFAGGQFGIGRRVNSAFLLAKPNSALSDQNVVTGRSLTSGEYYARSGAFGSALQGDLSDYSQQSVEFDAADPDNPFDVGDGTALVNPPYQSGYSVVVGEENYVSVIGTLLDPDGPVAVQSGVIRPVDPDTPFEETPFFTNRAGRFGLFGLAPGATYEIRLNQTGRTFVIEVPDDADPIIRLEPITLATTQ